MRGQTVQQTAKRTKSIPSQRRSITHSLNWTEEEIEQLCWDAGVLTKASVHGFRTAVTDAFKEEGYRLATITRDNEPFDNLHKLSLYSMCNDGKRLSRTNAKNMARRVMDSIGVRVTGDDCHADTSGKRLVVSVVLPRWAWPKL
jgi:hypothetical protein